MHIIKQVFCYLSLLLLTFSPLLGKESYQVEQQPQALEQAVSLQATGTLKQKENGFVYLDVSNTFIDTLIPILELPGELRPLPTAKRSVGAHISVFYEKEEIKPQELGETFSFSIQDIRSFKLHTRDGTKKLWVISVDSPELENLRQSYGCTPLLKGHAFHITMGKQMPAAPAGWEEIELFSPFIDSDEPTEGLFPNGDWIKVDNDELLATASKVDAVGQLKLKSNGFVYVDVSNDFIHSIADQLPLEGAFTPQTKGIGAHISVVYEDEMIGNDIWDFQDAGQWFSFEVKELRYLDRKTSKGNRRLWLLAVDAPALQRLRKHYGLKPKLLNHDFHITLGNEQIQTLFNQKQEELLPRAA